MPALDVDSMVRLMRGIPHEEMDGAALGAAEVREHACAKKRRRG